MSPGEMAVDDRLPWLADGSQARRQRGANSGRAIIVILGAAAAIAFAWLGLRVMAGERSLSGGDRPPGSTTMKVPEAHPPKAQKSRAAESPVDAQPTAAPPRADRSAMPGKASSTTIAARSPRPVAAAGRKVQIGAFGSARQARSGWQHVAGAYPAMARLPMSVRTARNSKGRQYYRFELNTTSQAHSEILCQRMQRIDFSCAVIGLPWKAKVER